MKHLRELRTAATAVIVFTILLGIIYPLVVTGTAQVVVPGKADGSRVKGGSSLIAQKWAKPGYFQPRPSATGYSATATHFANRGPNSAAARFFYRDRLATYIKRESPYNAGLEEEDVPVDAVTASGSGVDPHITVANARIQARRVTATRKLSAQMVSKLIDGHTDGRFIGLFGEAGVNTTTLNLALDKEKSR